jgi:hypothetical protein
MVPRIYNKRNLCSNWAEWKDLVVSDNYTVNESFIYVISSKSDRWPHEILSDGRLLIDKGNIATKRVEQKN